MSLSEYLFGTFLVACAALLGTFAVIAEQEWPTWRAYREERAQVVFATPFQEDLVGSYEDLLETIALYHGGKAVTIRVDYIRGDCFSEDDYGYDDTADVDLDDEDLDQPGWPSSRSRRGTWTLNGDRIAVTFGEASSDLRFGHLEGEPVLVGSRRVWRRVPER